MPTLANLIAVAPAVTDLLTMSAHTIRTGTGTVTITRDRHSREGNVDSYCLWIEDSGVLAYVDCEIEDGGDHDLVDLDVSLWADVVADDGTTRDATWGEILESLSNAEGRIASGGFVRGAVN